MILDLYLKHPELNDKKILSICIDNSMIYKLNKITIFQLIDLWLPLSIDKMLINEGVDGDLQNREQRAKNIKKLEKWTEKWEHIEYNGQKV